jgi:hypothetical protein
MLGGAIPAGPPTLPSSGDGAALDGIALLALSRGLVAFATGLGVAGVDVEVRRPGGRGARRGRIRESNELARAPFARIVVATELVGARSGHDPEGGTP